MKRLIVGSLLSVPLGLTLACSGDPTESLRGGIVQLNASPTQVFVQRGRTTNVDVTAADSQGNQIATAFSAADVGPGITVERDLTFQPVYVNDSVLSAPSEAATFRFKVTANDLVSSSFKITAGGREITIPVNVSADPVTDVAVATVTSAGTTAADPTVLTLPPPFIFSDEVAVTFDAGGAIVGEKSADGSTLTIFPPPGTTSVGTITGVGLSYLPTSTTTATTDVALSISPTVPSRPGTDAPTTAPDITPASGSSTAFYDGTAFAAATCGANSGVPCQLYKVTLPADGSIDVTVGWSNTADLGAYILTEDGTADVIGFPDSGCDVLGNGADGGQESCTFDLTAGTYLLAVVFFGDFYAPVDPVPDWISLSVTAP